MKRTSTSGALILAIWSLSRCTGLEPKVDQGSAPLANEEGRPKAPGAKNQAESLGVLGPWALELVQVSAGTPESEHGVQKMLVGVDVKEKKTVVLCERTLSARRFGDFVLFRDAEHTLFRFSEAGKEILLTKVSGDPAILPNGAIVVSRFGADPGETDLHLLTKPLESKALAPAPGPDDDPTALPDGRVLFVSGRTSLASLFIVDPGTEKLEQLTNRGLAAGGDRTGFVPPPNGPVTLKGDRLRYDAGDGDLWDIDLTTGQGLRVPR